MGVKLLKPLYATNSINANASTQRMGGLMAFNKNADANAPAPLAISPQRVEKTANVEIIYAIE
jgi:hypothetical protein